LVFRLVPLGTFGLNVYLFVVVPKGFFPQQDAGRLNGSIQAEQDISFPAMREKMSQFVNVVMADPAVVNVVAFTGGGGQGGSTTNTGLMFVALKPLSDRD